LAPDAEDCEPLRRTQEADPNPSDYETGEGLPLLSKVTVRYSQQRGMLHAAGR